MLLIRPVELASRHHLRGGAATYSGFIEFQARASSDCKCIKASKLISAMQFTNDMGRLLKGKVPLFLVLFYFVSMSMLLAAKLLQSRASRMAKLRQTNYLRINLTMTPTLPT